VLFNSFSASLTGFVEAVEAAQFGECATVCFAVRIAGTLKHLLRDPGPLLSGGGCDVSLGPVTLEALPVSGPSQFTARWFVSVVSFRPRLDMINIRGSPGVVKPFDTYAHTIF